MRFESRHRQNVIYQLYNRKVENKEKEVGNGPSFKKSLRLLKGLPAGKIEYLDGARLNNDNELNLSSYCFRFFAPKPTCGSRKCFVVGPASRLLVL